MTVRWIDRPRDNRHVGQEPSLRRLAVDLIACLWLCAVTYGVVVLLLAS